MPATRDPVSRHCGPSQHAVPRDNQRELTCPRRCAPREPLNHIRAIDASAHRAAATRHPGFLAGRNQNSGRPGCRSAAAPSAPHLTTSATRVSCPQRQPRMACNRLPFQQLQPPSTAILTTGFQHHLTRVHHRPQPLAASQQFSHRHINQPASQQRAA